MSEKTVEEYKKDIKEIKVKYKKLEAKYAELMAKYASKGLTEKRHDTQMLINFSIKFTKQVILIQATYRGYIQRQKFKKHLQQVTDPSYKPRIGVNSNEQVMQNALKAAQSIGLNLEMVYRACDLNYTGKITVSEFKQFLQRIKFKLTQAQLSRFLFIVDEECTGYIRKKDYDECLKAYNVNRETGETSSARSYEQESLIKLGQILKQNNISTNEVGSALDPANKGYIRTLNFKTYLKQLDSKFHDREQYAVIGYLDIQRNNKIDTKFLIEELSKTMKITNNTKTPQQQKKLPEIQRKDSISSSQASIQSINDKKKDNFISRPINIRKTEKNDKIEKIEEKFNQKEKKINQKFSGKILKELQPEFLEYLVKNMKNAGVGLTANELFQHADDFYKQKLEKSEKFSLMRILDTTGNGLISIFELRQLYGLQLSQDKVSSLKLSLGILARVIDYENLETDAYLDKFDITPNEILNEDNFIKKMSPALEISVTQTKTLFNELLMQNTNKKQIEYQYLVQIINSYRAKQPQKYINTPSNLIKQQQQQDNTSNINNNNKVSTASRQALQKLQNLLKATKKSPDVLFQQIDKESEGYSTTRKLAEFLIEQSLNNNNSISKQEILIALKCIDVDSSGVITKNEFKMVFIDLNDIENALKISNNNSNQTQNESTQKNEGKIQSQNQADSEMIQKFKNLLKKYNLTSQQFFDKSANSAKCISLNAFKDSIKKFFGNDAMDTKEIVVLFRNFDFTQDLLIDSKEWTNKLV